MRGLTWLAALAVFASLTGCQQAPKEEEAGVGPGPAAAAPVDAARVQALGGKASGQLLQAASRTGGALGYAPSERGLPGGELFDNSRAGEGLSPVAAEILSRAQGNRAAASYTAP